jgi:hypothetical protein
MDHVQCNGEGQARDSGHDGPLRRWSVSRGLGANGPMQWWRACQEALGDRPHVAEKLEQGLGADAPRQRWRACEAKVDGLEVYVMVWVIHITYEDQAEDTLFISSGFVNMSDNVFLAGINLWEFKTAGFRIDSHTIKRDKCSLHCGYLITIVSSNVVRYVSWWVAEKLKPLWKVR